MGRVVVVARVLARQLFRVERPSQRGEHAAALGAQRSERGTSLTEVVVAIAISATIMVALSAILVATLRDTGAGAQQQHATQQLRNALLWLNQDTQSAVASSSTVLADEVSLRWTDYSTGHEYESHVYQVGDELQREFMVDGVESIRTLADDLTPGGFTVEQAGLALTYTLSVHNGGSIQTQSETTMMRVSDTPPSPFATTTPRATHTPTATASPSATATPTAAPTHTPTQSATPTSTASFTSTATPTNTSTPVPTATNTATATATSTPVPWLNTGSYTGDGTDNRDIGGVGFQPDIVIVRAASDSYQPALRTANMPSDRAKVLASGSSLQANVIQSLDADGFEVGSADQVNKSGTTYHWVAMKAGANVRIGSYTGDGSDNRNITGLAFSPVWVMTLGDGQKDFYRPSSLGGDNAFSMEATGTDSNRIQSMLSNGFQVGSHAEVNESGRTYYYVAFAPTSKVSAGSYNGNAVSSRNITSPGFNPSFVWVKRSGEKAVWRTGIGGDLSLYWTADAPASNRIKAMLVNGFQVGNHAEVNAPAATFRYLALAP
jgi:hypothetical protein